MARGRLANRRRTPTPPSGLPRALLSGGVGGGTMASSQWDQLAGALLEFLPKATCPHRRQLLPEILQEWNRTDLRKHLAWESRATTRGRIKKLELVKTKARQLRAALNKLDERDRIAVLGQIIIAEGRRIGDVSRADVCRSNRYGYIRNLTFSPSLAPLNRESFGSSDQGSPEIFAHTSCCKTLLQSLSGLLG